MDHFSLATSYITQKDNDFYQRAYDFMESWPYECDRVSEEEISSEAANTNCAFSSELVSSHSKDQWEYAESAKGKDSFPAVPLNSWVKTTQNFPAGQSSPASVSPSSFAAV